MERESPRARILHKRTGRRQGARARRKTQSCASESLDTGRASKVCYGSGKVPQARILQQRAGWRQGARVRRKISAPASRNPSILSAFRKLLWERESLRARILQQRAGWRQGTRARRKISTPASRNPSTQAELRKLLWERQSPRARILQQRAEGGKARGQCEKSTAKLRLCPFGRRAPTPGADAAFVPRIGRAPFSGCAANAKKRCGSTPLR